MNRSRLAALSAGAMFLVASVFVPATASADTGNTNTIKVLGAPTITPPATGSSFTVNIVGNGSTAISGAGAGLAFDNTKLTLTAINKDATETLNGVSYLGYPSATNMASFIASANTAGQIPNISWSFLDGISSEPANSDRGIYTATFTVTALGDSTLTPNTNPTMLSGVAGVYGTSMVPLTIVPGTVVNHLAPVFSLSAPAAASVNIGATSPVTVTTGVVSGTPGPITLSTSALPAGVTAAFGTNPVAAGGSSVLTFTAAATAAPGTYPVTVSGTDGTNAHTATINLSVVAPNDFTVSAAPASLSFLAGGTGTSTVSTAIANGTPGTITLSATGLPAGVTATFTPASVTAGASASLSLAATTAATPGTYAVTVSGTNGTYTHTAPISLTVGPAPTPTPAGAQNVNVTGAMDGGFLGISCPTAVAMPLVRGNTNQTNAPCVVSTNTVWQLSANDTATADHVGFMTTGRPVDGTTKFALIDPFHVLSGGHPIGGTPFNPTVVYDFDHDLSNGAQSAVVASGTNSLNVGLVLSQYVAPGDHPGAYAIQIVFSAASIF